MVSDKVDPVTQWSRTERKKMVLKELVCSRAHLVPDDFGLIPGWDVHTVILSLFSENWILRLSKTKLY